MGRVLHHYDPGQLFFQLGEVVTGRVYLRHGIEVNEGDVVLDIGANVGVAAAFFASHCGAALVHSFEPVRPLFDLLAENLARYPACVVHDYGLAERAGTVEITFYPRAAAMSGVHADPDRDREGVRVYMQNIGLSEEEADRRLEGLYERELMSCEMRTLSSVIRDERIDRVDLLKVDVERAEREVLLGIEDEDWPRIRQLIVEVHDEDERLATMTADIEGRGFAVYSEQEPQWRGTGVHMLYAVRS